jgi:hypothetical protein
MKKPSNKYALYKYIIDTPKSILMPALIELVKSMEDNPPEHYTFTNDSVFAILVAKDKDDDVGYVKVLISSGTMNVFSFIFYPEGKVQEHINLNDKQINSFVRQLKLKSLIQFDEKI